MLRRVGWTLSTNPCIFSIFQSIAHIFMLTFYKIHGCVGTQRRFIEKKRQNVCEFPKKPLPLHSLSWKQSFYLRKLIPIEDMERSLAKVIALFFVHTQSVKLS